MSTENENVESHPKEIDSSVRSYLENLIKEGPKRLESFMIAGGTEGHIQEGLRYQLERKFKYVVMNKASGNVLKRPDLTVGESKGKISWALEIFLHYLSQASRKDGETITEDFSGPPVTAIVKDLTKKTGIDNTWGLVFLILRHGVALNTDYKYPDHANSELRDNPETVSLKELKTEWDNMGYQPEEILESYTNGLGSRESILKLRIFLLKRKKV